MTFDFFNPSHLAFGSKLTKAFNQLDRIYLDAKDAFDDLKRVYDTYNQYVGRNYLCPTPTRPDAPCRTNELFDLINDVNTIKELRVDNQGVLHCAVNIFKRSTNRITIASGTTELKSGYVFCTPSISNRQPERTLQFVEDESDGTGNFLFEYRIDDSNNINIVGDSSAYFLPGTFDSYTGMEYESDVLTDAHTGGSTYTATDNECIVCIGYARYGGNRQYTDGSSSSRWSQLVIRVNGELVFNIAGIQQRNFGVVYLKPGDVLSGDIKRAFKVKYNETKAITPTPVDVSFEVLENIGEFTTLEGSASSYLNNGGTFQFAATGTSSTIGFFFKCNDWSNVQSITIGPIGGENWSGLYSSIGSRGINGGGATSQYISDMTSPYTIDLDYFKNYYGQYGDDFKIYLSFAKYGGGTAGVSVSLSNFSFTYKN